jgi:hypothetical protein
MSSAAGLASSGSGHGGAGVEEEGAADQAQPAANSTTASAKLMLLLVQLCCVELRMALEDRTVDQIVASGELVTSCFVVIEAAIMKVVFMPDSERDATIVMEALGQMYERFAEVADAVAIGLMTVRDADGLGGSGGGTTKSEPAAVAAIVRASIRVLAAWLSEESDAVSDTVRAVLPFVLKTAAADQTNSPGLLRLMLSPLCHLTVSERCDIALSLTGRVSPDRL